MSIRYEHLLSPVQVGDIMLKNRMTSTAATPHFLQGTEPYPTEKWITMMANRAKDGAAGVYINHIETGSPEVCDIGMTPGHFSIMDFRKSSTHNYLCQMIDAIRYYGSVPITGAMGSFTRTEEQMMGGMAGPGAGMPSGGPSGAGPQAGGPGGAPGAGGPGGAPGGAPGAGGPGGMPGMFEEPFEEGVPAVKKSPIQVNDDRMPSSCNQYTKAQMQEYTDTTIASIRELKTLGFEMFSFHFAYRQRMGGELWSPLCNQRHDEYGCDSVENRARFFVEFFGALKETFGKGFPIEVLVSGTEPGGVTIADTVALSRLLEGKVDILSIRHGVQDPQHPTGFTSTRENPWPNREVTKAVAEDVRMRGGKLLVGATAGLHDPDFIENVLKNGEADVICMGRSFICDSEYGKKIAEGRGEDVTPCVRCNKCHVPNDTDKFRSFCSVNPMIGLETKIHRMTEPVTAVKKVGIVGGGPAGMYAALTAAKRGHKVTLYEKNSRLGGQLLHADYASFKWPIQDYKDWLIRQILKAGVEVRMNTEATKEMLKDEGFDNVIVAIGPVNKKPGIPGDDGPNVCHVMDVFGKGEQLPENIVVIGGSETGVETGMYLADCGKKVTVLCRQKSLASDAAHAHFVTMLEDAWLKRDTFYWIKGIQKYVAIDPDGVRYINYQGEEKKIACDLVVLSTGSLPNAAGNAALYGAAPKTDYVGDCFRVSNMHFAITTGFGAANQI